MKHLEFRQKYSAARRIFQLLPFDQSETGFRLQGPESQTDEIQDLN